VTYYVPYDDTDCDDGQWDDLDLDDVVERHAPEDDLVLVVDDPVGMVESLGQVLDYLEVDDRQKQLRALSYEEYLQTDHWKITRRDTLEHYRYRCAKYGGHRFLNVHHRTYRNLGAENPEDLEVLCRACHLAEHGHT